jgi:hypothetical protein
MIFYYFVNVTKNIEDIAGATNIKNVGIISLFESVIQANNWDSKDAIMAFPEQSDKFIMRYSNGDFEFKFKCGECDLIEDFCGCNDNIIEVLDNCTYCGNVLQNHAYGNICGKHIPSYALWDDSDYEDDYNIEEDTRYSRSDIDQGYGYECEGFEESCY